MGRSWPGAQRRGRPSVYCERDRVANRFRVHEWRLGRVRGRNHPRDRPAQPRRAGVTNLTCTESRDIQMIEFPVALSSLMFLYICIQAWDWFKARSFLDRRGKHEKARLQANVLFSANRPVFRG